MTRRARQLGRFATLLGALVFFMALVPLIPPGGLEALGLRLAFSVLLVSAAYVLSQRGWVFVVGLTLALLALTGEWSTHVFDVAGGPVLRMSLTAAFLVFTTGIVLRAILEEEEISVDTILGGINVYLLLAILFMLVHALLETVQPGAYVLGGVSLTDAMAARPEVDTLEILLYFSFTTLTTLGYGDITPAIGVAQMVSTAEAAVGQLYVAVFIARLVGLHVGHAMRTPS